MPEDYKNYKPMIFTVDVYFGNEIGNHGENDVSINDRPFIIQEVHHQLINPIDDIANPPVTSVQEMQDGLYRINWSLFNQRRFFQGPVPMADAAFGSIRHGRWIPLKVPVALEGNKTLNVEITNGVTRPAIAAKE